ncbi:hypothetical protein XENTR_v10024878 [Xenopus tropicalis]|nr:hypothetical protein XENTR_v10024878 [Xenopus tropicalis]
MPIWVLLWVLFKGNNIHYREKFLFNPIYGIMTPQVHHGAPGNCLGDLWKEPLSRY